MEFFQTIWTALTTPNEGLIKIILFCISFIDALVNMLLFTTILNINTSKFKRILYVFLIAIIGFTSRAFIPNPYATFLNLLTAFLFIKFILKTTILKSIIGVFISLLVSVVMELFLFKFYLTIFKIAYESVMYIPIYRLLFTLSIYLCIYFLYRIVKYCKFNINLENMTKRNRILFVFTTILGILAIGTQLYLISF